MRRMDRYKDEEVSRTSRIDMNKELYQNFSSNTIYTNITDVTNANAFEINNNNNNNSNKSHTTREEYQQMRKYQNIEPLPRNRKELEDVNYLMQKNESKVYDINSVLQEARKNRQDKDELEEKRKLKNNAYNILTDKNKETLEKYREEKKKRLTTPEEDEIRELIDTIASKTLAGELAKEETVDLLSDLMATNVLDKVEPQEKKDDEDLDEDKTQIETGDLSKEIEIVDKKEDDDEKTISSKEQFEKRDSDFYTRSMDLSDKDFDFSDEVIEKGIPIIIKILIALLGIAIVAITAYFIYQKIV